MAKEISKEIKIILASLGDEALLEASIQFLMRLQ